MTIEQKFRGVQFEIKELKDSGTFEGYGSVFSVEDSGRDVVVKGAFSRTIKELNASGKKLPILWQHNGHNPIGVYDELKEDDHGLFVKGRLLIDDVAQAKEAYALMKAGAVTGLSIGYSVQKYEFDEDTQVRKLLDVDLWEISHVTFPMNENAQISAIKNKLTDGDLPTEREFEKFLREAGFSKSQATVIASNGLGHLLRRDSAQEPAKLVETLKGFNLPTT